MKVLLDTNILIHREAATIIRDDVGPLFRWLDQLRYEKWVHPTSIAEIQKHDDPKVRQTFAKKLSSYHVIQVTAAIAPQVQTIIDLDDKTENDRNDSQILNEVFQKRFDILITEDKRLLEKADRLGVADRVLTIEGFLERILSENPALVDYKVLSVRKMHFGDCNLDHSFFDSFRNSYPGFNDWFNRKSQEIAYVSTEGEKLTAFLYLKVEDEHEPYPDIEPPFPAKRRLKIGTFKVELRGYRLGERFLKIIFDNAVVQGVDDIYVTIFPNSIERERLVKLLEEFGFKRHGVKTSKAGKEDVYVRDMLPAFNSADPRKTFPYISSSSRFFLVPIYPDYHTDLLPDSILNTESKMDFVEPNPHQNAISKVYISRSLFKNIRSGDIIVFYRTKDQQGPAYYTSVVSTIGIIERVYHDVSSAQEFIRLCRKRSVFTDEELLKHWNWNKGNRPFVVNFLYAYSFPKRPNLEALINNGVIVSVDDAPRGFEEITREQFETILRLSESDLRFIVD